MKKTGKILMLVSVAAIACVSYFMDNKSQSLFAQNVEALTCSEHCEFIYQDAYEYNDLSKKSGYTRASYYYEGAQDWACSWDKRSKRRYGQCINAMVCWDE